MAEFFETIPAVRPQNQLALPPGLKPDNIWLKTVHYHAECRIVRDWKADGWTGSGVGCHALEVPTQSPHDDGVMKYILRDGSFDWKDVLERRNIEFHP